MQVLHLDRIDLGVLSMPHNIFPRIRCFTSDRLCSMIAVVTSLSANGGDIIDSRRTKVIFVQGHAMFLFAITIRHL
jgi:hypothetical protein